MKKEMNKLIFLDKAVIFLKNNLTRSRSEIEEGLEDIIKQNIMKYLTNKVGYSKTEINNIVVTLVIDFEKKEKETKLVIEEYLFEINHKNMPLVRTFRLGTDNDHYVRSDLKELENEIDMFENGIGISKKNS